jgi:hypothetical protein
VDPRAGFDVMAKRKRIPSLPPSGTEAQSSNSAPTLQLKCTFYIHICFSRSNYSSILYVICPRAAAAVSRPLNFVFTIHITYNIIPYAGVYVHLILRIQTYVHIVQLYCKFSHILVQ